MLIPIRTDNRTRIRPWVNYGIVFLNVLVFLLRHKIANYQQFVGPYLLDPLAPQLEQFFSYAFLHADWRHLLGNMVFLWVFGNAVNDRLGHVAYAAFYLGGGVFSAIGYLALFADSPMLGASGAIAGVTGCYLVLFPRVRVTVLAFIIWIIPLDISSLYFIGFQIVFNMWMTLIDKGDGVAYAAHSAGYVYGIAVAAGLLALKLVPRDVYDLLSLWKTRRRRAAYRRMVSQGYDPFGRSVGSVGTQNRRWVPSNAVKSKPRRDTPSGAALELRQQISEARGMGNFPLAVSKYLELVGLSDDAVLPKQAQLDVAHQLMTEQRYAQAADAYERLLRHYRTYEHIEDIRLMLGIIYGRYLQQIDKAVENLRLAVAGLHDPTKKARANAELAALQRGADGP